MIANSGPLLRVMGLRLLNRRWPDRAKVMDIGTRREVIDEVGSVPARGTLTGAPGHPGYSQTVQSARSRPRLSCRVEYIGDPIGERGSVFGTNGSDSSAAPKRRVMFSPSDPSDS